MMFVIYGILAAVFIGGLGAVIIWMRRRAERGLEGDDLELTSESSSRKVADTHC